MQPDIKTWLLPCILTQQNMLKQRAFTQPNMFSYRAFTQQNMFNTAHSHSKTCLIPCIHTAKHVSHRTFTQLTGALAMGRFQISLKSKTSAAVVALHVSSDKCCDTSVTSQRDPGDQLEANGKLRTNSGQPGRHKPGTESLQKPA